MPACLPPVNQGLPHRKTIQPAHEPARVQDRRPLSECCQRHFLHDLVNRLPILQPRLDHATQPPFMHWQNRLPVQRDRASGALAAAIPCVTPVVGRVFGAFIGLSIELPHLGESLHDAAAASLIGACSHLRHNWAEFRPPATHPDLLPQAH